MKLLVLIPSCINKQLQNDSTSNQIIQSQISDINKLLILSSNPNNSVLLHGRYILIFLYTIVFKILLKGTTYLFILSYWMPTTPHLLPYTVNSTPCSQPFSFARKPSTKNTEREK